MTYLEEHPAEYVPQLSLSENVEAELHANDGLCEHDGSKHPTLCANAFTGGIGYVGVELPEAGRHDQADQTDAADGDRVVWRYLEDVLQEERVQFGEVPEDHELGDRDEAHVGAGLVEPSNVRPVRRRELENGTSNFAGGRLDVLDALPLVGAHLQLFADVHAQPDAETVADEHVQNERVPPALDEVRQQMCERDLGDLPGDADRPADAVVSNEHGLHRPAEEMAECERIQMIVQLLGGDVRAVHAVFLWERDFG